MYYDQNGITVYEFGDYVEGMGYLQPDGNWSELSDEENARENGISYDDEDIPEGCLACGGPYPDCMSSCNAFDD